MVIPALSQDQSDLIRRCLHAAVEGPFFDDAEFPTLIGVSRADARAAADAWPNVSATDEVVTSVINNMLLNLFGYPHGDMVAWDRLIAVDPVEVRRVWHKWKASTTLPVASFE